MPALAAALYDRCMAAAEAAGLGEARRRLLASATGRVLDVGAGTGANLPHYGRLESLDLVEPDPAMVARLRRRIDALGVDATVHESSLRRAGLPPASFDTIVCTLVLCSVRDVPATMGRLDELLAPGGRILFLEHVRGVGFTGRMQDAVDPVWKRVAGGCRTNRDTLNALRAGGFAVTDCDRLRVRRSFPWVATGVAGTAIRRLRPATAGAPADQDHAEQEETA